MFWNVIKKCFVENNPEKEEAVVAAKYSGKSNMEILRDELIRDEGVVLHAYRDHLGYVTIGIGRLIDKRRGGGITRSEAEYLLSNDLRRIEKEMQSRLPWLSSLDDARQRALLNMAFQMGVAGVMKFTNTLRMIEQGKYKEAGVNARLSKWYKQTPARAERVIKLIEQGSA